MLIHSKKGKQPTSLAFNELIFFTLLCASDCSPLWAQLPHIKPQFQKPTAKTKQALSHCLLFSFIHYFTSIIEPTLAMPYNGFYACSKTNSNLSWNYFLLCSAHLSDDQSSWVAVQPSSVLVRLCLFHLRFPPAPSTRPSARNNFSWVHRWAVTLSSGLRYPSNSIFYESWWCQLSKFGRKYKYKDKYRDKYKYRDK